MIDSQFYVHDSVAHVRRDLVQKRYLMSRDAGGKYYPMVEGASYRYQTTDGADNKDDYLLTFFTGQRSNGVGYHGNGVIDIGLGRNLRNDDYKGLPDGTTDDSIQELSFSFGIFKTNDVIQKAGQGQTEASRIYELHHLDKSSPITFIKLSNYLVDVEMGADFHIGDGKSSQRFIGQPLSTNVSFFEEPRVGLQTPAEIIELRKIENNHVAYEAVYLSRNEEKLEHL